MSVFNTKGTLLKWLKTLDQSLKDGVLQSVSVNPVSTGVITLSFNFADGTTVTTPQIELPEGERGPQGVPGADGADGTDGRDALVQNRALSSANISSPMAIPLDALNRTAVVGEPIVMFATDTTEEKTYMLIGTVTNVGSPGVNPYVFVTYSNKIDITGPQGPQGEPGESPDIPTPTTADNGKVLGVVEGAYALQEASGGGTQLYCHRLSFGTDSDIYHVINNSSSPIETLQDLTDNQLYIVGWLKVDTSWAPVIGYFDGLLVYINFTGNWTGVTGAAFATKEIASGTSISDTVNPL